jgi:hypothetical protein
MNEETKGWTSSKAEAARGMPQGLSYGEWRNI